MDKNVKQYNTDLDIKVSIGNLIINVFCINYEAPIPGWGYDNHSHSSYELHFVPFGIGTLVVGTTKYNIKPGTFYLTGPGVFHEQKSDRYDPMCEYCINFEISLKSTSSTKNKTYIQSEVNKILKTLLSTNFWFGKDEFSTAVLFEKVISEMENRKLGYYSYIQNLIGQIVLNALRCYQSEEESEYEIPRKILNDSRRYVIDKYFDDIERPLNREELAKKIGTSVRQLNRILKEYYAMGFVEKVKASRLAQVKYLLKNTEMSIHDIAFKTGFSSQNHLYKIFKGYCKISPSAYRKGDNYR